MPPEIFALPKRGVWSNTEFSKESVPPVNAALAKPMELPRNLARANRTRPPEKVEPEKVIAPVADLASSKLTVPAEKVALPKLT